MAADALRRIIVERSKQHIGDVADGLLEGLGETLDVSRAYVFRYERGDRLMVSQVREWVAPGVAPQIDNPDLQAMDLDAAGFGRWARDLLEDDVLAGPVATFPPAEQPLLEAQAIESLIVVPIWFQDEAWGFLGFDDCERPRTWSKAEEDALRHAATLLAEAIEQAARNRAAVGG